MSVLGVAGAVVGYFVTGTPQGAMLGYSLGSGVDAIVNAPNQDGPRLEDLRLQMSSYGAPIAFEWGCNRHSGTVIWPKLLDLKESSTTESAKGGPETTTYSYSASFAVLISDRTDLGPIKGIRRIWANKKIIYDASEENDSGRQKDPAVHGLRFYLGTEDQEPDPLIEATDGPSPAYLGYAYCVFEDLELGGFANRLPSLEFEVITKGAASTAPPYKFGTPWNVNRLGKSLVDTANNTLWVVNGTGSSTTAQTGGALLGPCINVYDLATKELLQVISYGLESGTSNFGTTNRRDYGALAYLNGAVYTSTPVTAIQSGMAAYGFSTSDYTQIAEVPFSQHPFNVFWPELPGAITALGDGTLLSATSSSTAFSAGIGIWNPASGLVSYTPLPTGSGWVYQALTMEDQRVALLTSNGLYLIEPAIPLITTAHFGAAQLGGALPTRMAYDSHNKRIMVVAGSSVWAIDVSHPDGTTDYITNVYTAPAGAALTCIYEPIGDAYYIALGHVTLQVINGDLSLGESVSLSGMTDNPIEMQVSVSTGELIFVCLNSIWAFKVRDTLTPGKIPLWQIVRDLCAVSGLADADLDVGQLTDLVDGYIVPRQMSARAAIEPLQTAFYFDAVESDDRLKFVKRGQGGIAATIPIEDRAAHDYGGELPDSLTIVRAQELELPVEVTVEYPDIDADHLVGAQYSRRLTKDTRQKLSIQTPVVMTATKAKQVSEVNLYDAWQTQTYKWTTGRAWAHLEPTDVVELPTAAANYTARITTKREQPGGVIEWEGKQDGVTVYQSTGDGAVPNNYVSQAIYNPASTNLELLDIPMLRDADNNGGFYVAMG